MSQMQWLQIFFLQHKVFFVFPHTTIPQPDPSKVTFSRTAQVNADQLEVLQPFRLL